MEHSTPNQVILEAQADAAVKMLLLVSKGGSSTTIFSPLSVSIAMAMAYAGAKDKTAEEIGKFLANGAPEAEVHGFFGELQKAIQQPRKDYTLEMANKVYVKSNFPILEGFNAAIEGHYGVGQFESGDFTQSVATTQKINDFVANATHDKIRDLISTDSLNEDTRLVLINAIYFKGMWADKFEKYNTRKKPFYSLEGTKQLEMMYQSAEFIYHKEKEFQLLGMPYVGDEMCMFVLLPTERFGLGKLLENMSGKKLMTLLTNPNNQYKSKVEVTLPKFKLESTHKLIGPLKKLGVVSAFGAHADFGKITDTEPLLISQVIQKAFIEVNEEGTEATAASGCFLNYSLVILKFVADHPFAAFICKRDTGNILFATVFHG